MIKKIPTVVIASLVFQTVIYASDYQITGTFNKPDGIYNAGEKVILSVQLLKDKTPVKGKLLKCTIKDQKQSAISLKTEAAPVTLTASLPYPGKISFTIKAFEEDGKTQLTNKKGKPLRFNIGAMVEPLKLKTNIKEPKDFDAFWNAQKAKLAKIPFSVKRTEVASPSKGFKVYDVEIACDGKTPARGYLSIPEGASPGSLPIYFETMGACTTSANKRPRKNMIVFNINAHGCKNGQSKEFYKKFFSTIAKNYPHQGRESRATCYFRTQVLRLLRGLEFVKTLPEWNKKDLIIAGTSMGGSQSIVGAAMDPDVTLCITNDPALCDHGGLLDTPKRNSGWPRLIDKNKPETIITAGYFDNIFFARRIKCETYFATGFADNTCNSEGVFIAYNNVPGKKFITTNPSKGHCGTRNTAGYKRIQEIQKNNKQK